MRPIHQQTILVTGATDGLGKALAHELARLGATVLLHGRSKDRLEAAVEETRKATRSDRPRSYLADFSRSSSVTPIRPTSSPLTARHSGVSAASRIRSIHSTASAPSGTS